MTNSAEYPSSWKAVAESKRMSQELSGSELLICISSNWTPNAFTPTKIPYLPSLKGSNIKAT